MGAFAASLNNPPRNANQKSQFGHGQGGFSMKRAFLVAVCGLVILGAGFAANAQPSVYVVNVPFPFFVGQQQLPAGTYYVDSKRPFDSSSLTLEFIRSGGHAGIALPAAATLESKEKIPTPKLVFHQYGGFYFLSQFWGADGRGKQLAESSRETELAKKQAPTNLSIAAR
jgi:hypothetical protein